MKKLLILFGVTNILLGLLFFFQASLTTLPRSMDTFILYGTATLFFIAGAGLLFKKKFAWTLNFLLSMLVVSIALSATISLLTLQNNLRILWPVWVTLLKIFVVGLALSSLFSLLRTLKNDFTSALKIGPGQKWITITVGVVLSATWLITTLASS